jgi:lycopene beta-cyclase
MPSDRSHDCDIAIAGGGLAGGLIALALKQRRPELRVMLVEGSATLGGNHIWSFFDTDIAPEDWSLVEPLISHRWHGYDVLFPGHNRTLDATYNAIESEQFDAQVRAMIGSDAIIPAQVVAIEPDKIVLDNQAVVHAKGVIDTRGPGDVAALDTGWQKFAGQLLRLKAPHGLMRPIVMDATVDQLEGYRFVYCLPFSDTEVFVEDTYYSDTPDLDPAALTDRIAAYAASRGWQIAEVSRQESGVLPVTMNGDFAQYWESTGEGVAKAGMRSGLFHPTTGYSLPDAVRMASRIAAAPDLTGNALHTLTRDYAASQWKRRGFYRMLDDMLFRAADPDKRYKVLEHFYRRGPDLIRRFYAGESTLADKARILSGKPPVPLWRAMKVVMRRAV